jgi:hypothetical protein
MVWEEDWEGPEVMEEMEEEISGYWPATPIGSAE